MKRFNNNDYVKMSREEIQDTLNDITLDTSRLTCFALITDDEAEKVSEYNSELSEILFSLADAIKVYANKIDDKVVKICHTLSENKDPKNNHNGS